MRTTKRHINSVMFVIFAIATLTQTTRASNQIKISGGEDHTLVLSENKFVWSCGSNYFYQLGTGNSQDQWTLTQVLGGTMNTLHLQDINEVAAGWTHSLALDVDSFVWAWGTNSQGQLGDGSDTPRSTPVGVKCGEQNPSNPDSFLESIVAISAGRSGRQSLALDVNNLVYAWGYNKYGQCGNDISESNEYTPVRVLRGQQPQDVNNPNLYLKHIIAISAGADQSMALEKDDPDDPNLNGCAYTWGTNRWGDEDYEQGWIPDGNGLLGTGSTVAFEDTPVKVHGVNDVNFLEHIVAIAAGWDHCMALERDDPFEPNWQCPTCKGRVYTWGNNDQGYGGGQSSPSSGGRLGDGTTISRSTPVLVLKGRQDTSTSNYLEHIVAIAAGEGHSIALDNNGNVYAWGDNQFGQLGNGTNDPCTTPVKVVGPDLNKNGIHEPNEGYLENVVAISAGHWHCIAVDVEGTIWTWGKGAGGQLGIGTDANENTPQRVPVVHNLTRVPIASYFRIQAAIDDANNGDILEASLGTYSEYVDFGSKAVTLRSTNPNNWNAVENTIISGSIHYGEVATFNNNSGSVLNGLTLTNANYGVHCYNSSISITNCDIQDNTYGIYGYGGTITIAGCNIANSTSGDGIYAYNSGLVIDHTLIANNGSSGLYTTSGCDLVLNNSVIRYNGRDGVTLDNNHATTIKNNWIHNNGTKHQNEAAGIWFGNQVSVPLVRNNTICANYTHGIEASQQGADPNILNCIIYANVSGDLLRISGTFNTVNYCCLQDTHSGTGNITGDPGFMNIAIDSNDLHLAGSSQCKDTGAPYGNYDSETDIDGEARVKYGRVDIGADEYYWSPADFSEDGIVNFIDYAMLAWHWHETDANGGYDDVFDLADNNAIDFGDILAFCDEWLWEGGFLSGSMPLMAGRVGAGMVEGLGLDAGLSAVATAERGPAIAEPVDIEAIMKWLAEIWLDPDVRKSIDEEKFLEVYESLKGL